MSESGTPWGPYRDLGAPLVFHNEVRIEQAEVVCTAGFIFLFSFDVFFVIFNMLGIISFKSLTSLIIICPFFQYRSIIAQ